ncbi:hypothetical protein BGX23_005268 [Mortierella sp. AD031]|nr:hypothetical protein BGX23_005268 [Mortierella sp. AD031]
MDVSKYLTDLDRDVLGYLFLETIPKMDYSKVQEDVLASLCGQFYRRYPLAVLGSILECIPVKAHHASITSTLTRKANTRPKVKLTPDGGPLATDSESQRVKLNRGSAADQAPSTFQPRDHGTGSGSNRRNIGYGGGRSYRPLNSPFKRFGGSGGEHR